MRHGFWGYLLILACSSSLLACSPNAEIPESGLASVDRPLCQAGEETNSFRMFAPSSSDTESRTDINLPVQCTSFGVASDSTNLTDDADPSTEYLVVFVQLAGQISIQVIFDSRIQAPITLNLSANRTTEGYAYGVAVLDTGQDWDGISEQYNSVCETREFESLPVSAIDGSVRIDTLELDSANRVSLFKGTFDIDARECRIGPLFIDEVEFLFEEPALKFTGSI